MSCDVYWIIEADVYGTGYWQPAGRGACETEAEASEAARLLHCNRVRVVPFARVNSEHRPVGGAFGSVGNQEEKGDDSD